MLKEECQSVRLLIEKETSESPKKKQGMSISEAEIQQILKRRRDRISNKGKTN